MANQISSDLRDKISKQLSIHLSNIKDGYDHNDAYTTLREDISNGIFDTFETNLYIVRLAAEYSIKDIEIGRNNKLSKSEVAIDPWSMLDPTSKQYLLNSTKDTIENCPNIFHLSDRIHLRVSPIFSRLLGILSLWFYELNHDASQDRIGFIWLFIDPLIQIMVICSVPLLIQPEFVYDMAILPFSIIGAIFWLVFRTSAINVMTGGGSLKPQLEHPHIRKFDIMVAKAFYSFVNYFFAGVILLFVTVFFHLTDGPQNFLILITCFTISWIIGICFGIIANSLINLYPAIRRLIAYSLRFIGLASGLFYIPEQLPQRISEFLLYNPLLQLVQAGRSYWFYEYSSMDVNFTYIFYWFISLIFLALICLIIDEKKPSEVRA